MHFSWAVPVTPYCHLSSWVLGGAQDAATVFGVDAALLQVVASAQAICCNNEADRVNTAERTSLLPECLTNEEAIAYLKSLQVKFYKVRETKVFFCFCLFESMEILH